MYKITAPSGVIVLIENPKWIRVHPKNPNCFLLCKTEKEIANADGISYKGSPFLFRDGTMVHEVDAGDEFAILQAENESLRNQLAETEEAIIEVYETMEGLING